MIIHHYEGENHKRTELKNIETYAEYSQLLAAALGRNLKTLIAPEQDSNMYLLYAAEYLENEDMDESYGDDYCAGSFNIPNEIILYDHLLVSGETIYEMHIQFPELRLIYAKQDEFHDIYQYAVQKTQRTLRNISLSDAYNFTSKHVRTNLTYGQKWALGLFDGDELFGVSICGCGRLPYEFKYDICCPYSDFVGDAEHLLQERSLTIAKLMGYRFEEKQSSDLKEIRAVPLKDANAFISKWHSHNGPVTGCKFALGLFEEGEMTGCAVCGRPVSRFLQDGFSLEINRLCLSAHGQHNAASMLYGRCAKIAQVMGYKKIYTYTCESEAATSLVASGFRLESEKCGNHRWTGRRSKNLHRMPSEYKKRWSRIL